MSTEYKYPMWFKSSLTDGLIVKFTGIRTGEVVVQGVCAYRVGYVCDTWIEHNNDIWENVSNLFNPLKFGSVPFSISERPKVSHYQSGGIEPIDYINSHNMNFNCGCVVKYITRNGKKENETAIKDLKKAIDYINFEIERLKGLKNVEK